MRAVVRARGDRPDVPGVAAQRVPAAVTAIATEIAVAPARGDLAGVRPVLRRASRAAVGVPWPGWRAGWWSCPVRDADGVQVEPVGGLPDEQEDQLVTAVEPVAD